MNASRLTLLAVVPAALLTLTSGCSTSKPSAEGAAALSTEHGVPGGTYVETHQVTATVTAIDAANRKVTLAGPDGKKTVVKAPPEAINFDRIHVGDVVKATVTEELVVAVVQPGEGVTAAVGVVALAAKGAKPGGLMADTVQVTAKIVDLDFKHQKATLLFPDGSKHIVAVRKDVDLMKRKLGEEVVIRSTEAFLLTVEKP